MGARMVLGEVLALLMFAVACGVLMLGFPVAFTLAGVALSFAAIGSLSGVFDLSILHALPSRYFGTMTNDLLVAVPLFVFMGVMLEKAKVAENLLMAMAGCFGRKAGGLGISVVVVGGLLAASTGIVGATVVTMGLLSLPAMLRSKYDPKLACGVICASGTLGQIIPPSVVLVLLGDILQSAYTQAQQELGNWAPEPVSVVDLFVGAIVPGLLLVAAYIGWIAFVAWRNPERAPALPATEGESARPAAILRVLLPPLALIVAVLGSILCGIATPTEGAAVGAAGAALLAVFYREMNTGVMRHVMQETVRISAMVFVILMGASVFSLVFRELGGDALVRDAFAALPGGKVTAIAAVMALMFILGFFLDFIEIVFIVVPIVGPALLLLDVNPVWLGVMMAVNLQTSFLTPPFGFALFYLRGVAPPGVTTGDIYRGVVPFVVLQILVLAVIGLFPGLVTYLPEKIL